MPKLTVVLCNYNHAKYLSSAIDAIANQSRLPDEFIIIDDASTDISREIIAEYAAKYQFIRPIYKGQNSGVVDSINQGLALGQCEFIYFAAADDRVLPGFIESSMRGAELHPDSGVICCDPVWFEDSTGRAWCTPLPFPAVDAFYSGAQFALTQMQFPFSIPGHATIINRQEALLIGGLIPELKWYSDWFMNLVAAYRQGIYYIPAPNAALRAVDGAYSNDSRHLHKKIIVLKALGEILLTPRFADIRHPLVESAILGDFGWPLIWAFSTSRRYRSFLTLPTIRRILRTELIKIVRRSLPEIWKRKLHKGRMVSTFVGKPVELTFDHGEDRKDRVRQGTR